MSFTAGMKVAVKSGFSRGEFRVATVDKVYKNGNFILVGDETKQQWKSYSDGKRAERVGETSHYPTTVNVMDDEFTAKEKALQEQRDHLRCANALQEKLRRIELRFLTSEQLCELEALVEKLQPTTSAV